MPGSKRTEIPELVRVVVVEDHELTRVGLKLTLTESTGVQIVGEAEDGRAGIEQVMKLQPHVVLMDIGLPLVDGIEATAVIKTRLPNTRVVVLTSHDNDRDIFAALGAGADGYCLKETPTTQLALAIRTVASGAAWLDPGIARRVLAASVTGGTRGGAAPAAAAGSGAPGAGAKAGAASGISKLSQREIEVLKLVVDGLSNQQIAERLIVSVETVKTHMRRLMEKLAVSDRTQAAVKAMREGLM